MGVILNFKNAPLPNPGVEYDPQYIRQMIRVIEIYFDQLNSWNLQVYGAITASGATADRPTFNLSVGQYYFDTDLGIPIWYDGTDWVDAAGTVV